MYLKALFLSALSTLVAADVYNPIVPLPGQINVGEPTIITWKPNTSGTIALQLRWGPAGALNAGTPIASGLSNTGSYTWTPDPSIAPGSTYTVQITDEADTSETNFSPTFGIVGGTGPIGAYGPSSALATESAGSTMTLVTSMEYATSASPHVSLSVTVSAVANSTMWTTTKVSATKTGSSLPEATTNAAVVLGGGAVAALAGLGVIAAGVL